MDLANLLKSTANLVIAATLAKRVTADVVRSLPYPAIGAATLVGLVSGMMLAKQRRRRRTQAGVKRATLTHGV